MSINKLEVTNEDAFIRFINKSMSKSKVYQEQWDAYVEEVTNWLSIMSNPNIGISLIDKKENEFTVLFADVMKIKIEFVNRVLNAYINYYVVDSGKEDREPFYTLKSEGSRTWDGYEYVFQNGMGHGTLHFMSVLSTFIKDVHN